MISSSNPNSFAPMPTASRIMLSCLLKGPSFTYLSTSICCNSVKPFFIRSSLSSDQINNRLIPDNLDSPRKPVVPWAIYGKLVVVLIKKVPIFLLAVNSDGLCEYRCSPDGALHYSYLVYHACSLPSSFSPAHSYNVQSLEPDRACSPKPMRPGCFPQKCRSLPPPHISYQPVGPAGLSHPDGSFRYWPRSRHLVLLIIFQNVFLSRWNTFRNNLEKVPKLAVRICFYFL